jgi:hypothetical protein
MSALFAMHAPRAARLQDQPSFPQRLASEAARGGGAPQAERAERGEGPPRVDNGAAVQFQTSDNCLACHNTLKTSSGEDVSIGSSWRASMMANSSRDPYWQASVRREVIDHPSAQKEIEDECSVCHMPMSRTLARSTGKLGEIFAHLPIARAESDGDRLAADGVSCTLCHQIGPDRLGTRESFTGGYTVKAVPRSGSASIFGPFNVDVGRTALMHSATGVKPAESVHVQQSELCATCHTLYTTALDSRGQPIGSLPEQVPFLEWRHSAYRTERSCQSCHMPAIAEPTPVSSVLGEPREGFSRHTFIGGNFFMLGMLNRYRQELGVAALPAELAASARATLSLLESETANVSIPSARIADGALMVEVGVRNLTGHKLPTGYPARRAWLHVTVRDRTGRPEFESGEMAASGAIAGNDNDRDAARFEPHYDEIRTPDQVQVYESIMVDAAGVPTTGLLHGLRFAKDNRLLPRGFDKASAEADISVHGDAEKDDDFGAEGDRVRYVINVGAGPFRVDVELRYQPISFRWAENLRRYDAPEPKRFLLFYESMSSQSSTVLARASAIAE